MQKNSEVFHIFLWITNTIPPGKALIKYVKIQPPDV